MRRARTRRGKGYRYDRIVNVGLCHYCMERTHSFKVFGMKLLDPNVITKQLNSTYYQILSYNVRYLTIRPDERLAVHLCHPCALKYLVEMNHGHEAEA